MKLVFSGLELPIRFESGVCSTIEIANEALFARIAVSLLSGLGDAADEPYSFWEDHKEVKSKDALLFISSPLELPWNERLLAKETINKIEREFLLDESARLAVGDARNIVTHQLRELSVCFEHDYDLEIEWDFKKLLKFCGFDVSYSQDKSLLDNLMNFLSYAKDSGDKRVLVFANLKNFLTENEFNAFLEHVFYLKIKVLLIENKQSESRYSNERKLVVDHDFLEFYA